MTLEKWQDLVESVREKYELHNDFEAACDDGVGKVHTIEFEGPGGKVKLEFTSRPIKLDTKTHYSRRIGGDVSVEHTYSDTEESHRLKAFSWNKDEESWQEINSDTISS